jgi:hypothetical protein
MAEIFLVWLMGWIKGKAMLVQCLFEIGERHTKILMDDRGLPTSTIEMEEEQKVALCGFHFKKAKEKIFGVGEVDRINYYLGRAESSCWHPCLCWIVLQKLFNLFHCAA